MSDVLGKAAGLATGGVDSILSPLASAISSTSKPADRDKLMREKKLKNVGGSVSKVGQIGTSLSEGNDKIG